MCEQISLASHRYVFSIILGFDTCESVGNEQFYITFIKLKPGVKTSFAKRLPLDRHPQTYNIICRKISDVKNLPTPEYKQNIGKWLLDVNHQQTEDITSNN